MSSRGSLLFMRMIAFVILSGLSGAGSALAGAITFQTQGYVWPWTFGNGSLPAITGPNVIRFEGVRDGSFNAPGTLPLGRFILDPLPSGNTTTYHNAAFSITVNTSLGGAAMTGPNDHPYSSISLYGLLNGTLSGNNLSTVVAEVRDIRPSPFVTFPESSIHPVLDLPFPLSAFSVRSPLGLVPSAVEGGQTSIFAQVFSVPEPFPAALLSAGFLSLVLRRARNRPRIGRASNRL